jgi:gamma-glutamyltranspeptidase/glutathione hydrolase
MHSSDNFSDTQKVAKVVIQTAGGVVSSQHKRAAQVGATVLEQGGDAVDAAIATSFALGVVEPWMSGLAAGGCMVLWRSKEQKAYAVDFGMRSPRSLDPKNYPLSGQGKSSDLFPWAHVVDDRNVQGVTAVAVPGVVSGMDLAHQRFGTKLWKELVEPAAQLAQEGLLVDWYSTLITASNAQSLAADIDAANLFLDQGQWPISGSWTALTDRHLNQQILSKTLLEIANNGAESFYQGKIAHALVQDIQAKGGCLSLEDLSHYCAQWVDPLAMSYRGATIYGVPGLTGAPTLAKALSLLEQGHSPKGAKPDAQTYVEYATALRQAFTARLESMGDHESPQAPGSTTHFSVVDRHGNMCSVTQTLLSIFGSRVVSPSTGILLNNGIMWFDPEPGKPNSLGPNKRCLANYCPVIGRTEKNDLFAIGASGGRKILGAVMQLSSFMIDFGFNLEQAFHQPRIDLSGVEKITADPHLGQEVIDALSAKMSTSVAKRNIFPYSFACPAGVMRANELNSGCTEIMSPWGDAVLERQSIN